MKKKQGICFVFRSNKDGCRKVIQGKEVTRACKGVVIIICRVCRIICNYKKTDQTVRQGSRVSHSFWYDLIKHYFLSLNFINHREPLAVLQHLPSSSSSPQWESASQCLPDPFLLMHALILHLLSRKLFCKICEINSCRPAVAKPRIRKTPLK